MGSSSVIHFEYEKETKNKVRYNDNGDFGVIYVPKSTFAGKIPTTISMTLEWN